MIFAYDYYHVSIVGIISSPRGILLPTQIGMIMNKDIANINTSINQNGNTSSCKLVIVDVNLCGNR